MCNNINKNFPQLTVKLFHVKVIDFYESLRCHEKLQNAINLLVK